MNELNKAVKLKLEHVEELKENFGKIEKWISPFVQGNGEVEEAIRKVNSGFVFLVLDDLIIVTLVEARSIALANTLIPKICPRCLEELEKEGKHE